MDLEARLHVAQTLHRGYGGTALAIAREQTFAMKACGDMKRYAEWRHIYALIREFQRTRKRQRQGLGPATA